MSRERSDAQPGGHAAPQRTQARLRVAVIDRDPGFMQVLANRLGALGCEHRALSSPATVETLVAMRLNALVLDLTVVGPESWEYLERVCARLPGLAGGARRPGPPRGAPWPDSGQGCQLPR